MKFVKFRNVTEKELSKKGKGDVFSKIGGANSNFRIWALLEVFGKFLA